MIDARFNLYNGLLSYDHIFETGACKRLKQHVLECWLEFEPSDPSVGLSESWSVFHAYLGGVDISELLSEEVKTEIIEQAQLAFESFEEY